jgi:hypothetical protein
MPQGNSLDFPTVCKYVGQLFLESRHELEQSRQREAELADRFAIQLATVEKERDDALRLIHDLRSKKE